MTKCPLLFAVMLLLVTGTHPAPGQETSSPLRSTKEIRNLPRQRQEEKPAVDLECIVIRMMNGAPFNFQIWQDGTALYVNATVAASRGVNVDPWQKFKPGDRVRLRGKVQEGHFAPTIEPVSMEFLSSGPLPEPSPIAASDLSSGQLDGQWVTITGVVQALQKPSKKKYSWSYELGSPQGEFTALIDRPAATNLLGSEVSLRGICLPYMNYRGQMLGMMVALRSPDDIKVVHTAEQDPFLAPVVFSRTMRDFDPSQGIDSGRRVMKGVVTYIQPGAHLLLESEEHGVKIGLAPDQSARVGDLVEAAGFVRMTDNVAELKNALIRVVGTAPLPEPLPLTSAALSGTSLVVPGTKKPGATFLPDFHHRLATLSGTLLQTEKNPLGANTLWIENPGNPPLMVPVSVPPGLVPPPIGSVVEALGISEMQINPEVPHGTVLFPTSVTLSVSRPQDLKLVKAPEWWTPIRLRILGGIIATVLVVTLLQIGRLRRRVRLSRRAMTDAQKKQQAAETRSEERQRLAEEIHDTMAQNLTGVALQIGAAGMASAAAPPEVSQHLKLASGMLDFAREEIRRTLFDLRSGQLENGNLTDTLYNITRMITKSRACDVDWEVTGSAPYVHPLTAHSLLRVAQESLDNSLKHGRASRIRVHLHYSESAVRLTITDNGHGCGPGPLPGPMEGHFGIENMRGWVRRLEGDFQFHSLPGSGTAVTATIPIQPNNPNPGTGPAFVSSME